MAITIYRGFDIVIEADGSATVFFIGENMQECASEAAAYDWIDNYKRELRKAQTEHKD